MSEQSKMRRGIGTVVFMLVSSAVFIGGVSAVYQNSKGRIALNERLAYQRSALYAAGVPVPAAAVEVNRAYDASFKIMETRVPGIHACYTVRKDGGADGGLLLEVSGPGLWGTITALVALESDMQTIAGIDFIRQNETPGLGARIAEDWFRGQFRGKQGPLRIIGEGSSAKMTEFNGITGATVTTAAVRDILNEVLRRAPGLMNPDKAERG